ncbi:MAG: ABC transporter substrate-binding protein [Coriobacteriia bacterium]|nr:ABC transporter substrate-binding protein [Coriobacteriia bacterium]
MSRLGRWKRDRATTALIVVSLACAVMPTLGGCDRLSPEPDVAPIPVSLGVSREELSALAYIARAEGLFAGAGLEVDFKEYSSSQLALEALLAGEVDAALCADTPIVLTSLGGKPVRIVATAASDQSDIRIVARSDAGISEPADLRGKRVGTREGTAAHFFLHGFLIKHGMSESDVEISFDSFEAVTAALIDGRLDAVSLRQPFVSELEDALGDDFVLFEEHGLYEKTMNLCVRPDDASPAAETLQRLIEALLEAERVGVADTTGRTREELADALGISTDQLCDCIISEGAVGLRQSLVMTLEDQARWAAGAGIVDPGVHFDFLRLLDTRLLDAVAPERVTVIR